MSELPELPPCPECGGRGLDQRDGFPCFVCLGTCRSLGVDHAPVMPQIGDYVLATKYEDGDPGDMWALGFYDGVLDDQGRHYVKNAAGQQIRGNGFRRVARIRGDVGRWLLEVAAPQLERCPAGTVNLWTMLTPAAFDLGRDTAAIRAQE